MNPEGVSHHARFRQGRRLYTSSRWHYAAVVDGRRGVTSGTVLRSEHATGTDADSWLDLQTRWDMWHALR